jgi:hypothetical protein
MEILIDALTVLTLMFLGLLVGEAMRRITEKELDNQVEEIRERLDLCI